MVRFEFFIRLRLRFLPALRLLAGRFLRSRYRRPGRPLIPRGFGPFTCGFSYFLGSARACVCTHPSLTEGAGNSAETPPAGSLVQASFARPRDRRHHTQRYSVLHHLSSIHWAPFFSIFPLRERAGRKESRLAKEAQRGSKHGVRATVQTDVAVVRLLFGPSLSPLGYGVGSPRSRKLLWPFQTPFSFRFAQRTFPRSLL